MLPHAEVPDHLPFVLELTALVDSDVGCRLFTEHRVPIDVLRDGLVDVSSLYEHPITEFCETPDRPQPIRRCSGRSAWWKPEAVGLQPLTLSVPPKRR